MTTFLTGIILVVLVVSFFVCSLPRGGNLAWFVGTRWETPLVLGAVGSLLIGFVLVMDGWSQLKTGVQ
jgi:uncharacterized integral membrane protein